MCTMKKQQTSTKALASVKPHLPRIRARILEYIASREDSGATCDGCERRLRYSHQTTSSAIHWQREHGKIKDSGLRRPTRSGRDAIVWVAK
jgi:hypothetical protein